MEPLRRYPDWEAPLHALHLYGAAGIAAFGWAVCRLLECRAERWWPLWFCAAVLIYNLDRIWRDPADLLNTPRRVAAVERCRRWSIGLAASAGLAILVLPLARQDWLTVFLVVTGGAVCVHYSLPLGGWRWKDVPLLKTFFAPGIVAAAIFGLPLLHEPEKFTREGTWLLILWGALPLLINMVLCDLRDLRGDCARGVVSLPGWLGPEKTWRLLWLLAALACGLAAWLGLAGPAAGRRYWLFLWPVLAAYLVWLLLAARTPQPERFYERWVEGLLYLPAAVLLALDACAA